MFRRFEFGRFTLGSAVSVLVAMAALVVIVLCMAHPAAAAATVTGANAASVNFQAFLQECVQAAGAAALAMLTAAIALGWQMAEKRFGLKNDETIRNAMLQIADDAVHYGTAVAGAQVGKLSPVNVGNPVISAGVTFFLNHAQDEIAHFHLSGSDAERIVQAAYGRIANFTSQTKGSST